MRQLRRVKEIKHYDLKATDGDLGQVEDVFFDDSTWTIRYFVIRTGSWLKGQKVLISPKAIEKVDDEASTISISLSMKQVEKSPPVDTEKPISRQYEEIYYQYYNWEPYWKFGLLPSLGFPPIPAPYTPDPPLIPQKQEGGDPHLRSTEEVTGYYIHALDGEIGHAEDFVLDDDSDWKVRYIEIDTRNWLPGKKVLLATAWVQKMSWGERQIHIDLLRGRISSAPEYIPNQVISPDFELDLFKHYGKALKSD